MTLTIKGTELELVPNLRIIIEISYLKNSRNYTISWFNHILACISLAVSLAFILIHIDVELLYFLSFIYFVLRLCIF